MIEVKKRAFLNDYAFECIQFIKISPQEQSTFNTFIKKLGDILPVIEPESLGYVYWQILNCLLILFFLFEIPFIMFFKTEIQRDHINIIYLKLIILLGFLIFTVDIFVSLDTAIY